MAFRTMLRWVLVLMGLFAGVAVVLTLMCVAMNGRAAITMDHLNESGGGIFVAAFMFWWLVAFVPLFAGTMCVFLVVSIGGSVLSPMTYHYAFDCDNLHIHTERRASRMGAHGPLWLAVAIATVLVVLTRNPTPALIALIAISGGGRAMKKFREAAQSTSSEETIPLQDIAECKPRSPAFALRLTGNRSGTLFSRPLYCAAESFPQVSSRLRHICNAG
ncbi:MAG: hypothetical protein WAM90_15680 [Rhodanobacter sp.]